MYIYVSVHYFQAKTNNRKIKEALPLNGSKEIKLRDTTL